MTQYVTAAESMGQLLPTCSLHAQCAQLLFDVIVAVGYPGGVGLH